MLAKDIKEKFIQPEEREHVGVIAIVKDGKWYHVHDNEEIPEDATIALHPRNLKKGEK